MSPKPSSPVKNNSLIPSKLVREALSFVKSHRSLWWVGILAGLGQGYGTNPQVVTRFNSNLGGFSLPQLDPPSEAVGLLLLFILFVLLGIWVLSVLAEAGLILTVASGNPHSFKDTLKQGRPALWPLIKLNLFVAVISITAALLFGFLILGGINSNSLAMSLVGGFLMISYGLLLALLFPWIVRAVVLAKKSPLGAVTFGWRLFLGRLKKLIILGLGGLFLQILGTLLILLMVSIAFIPLAFLIAWAVKGLTSLTMIGVLLIGALGVAIILAGILTAVKSAYYTLAFGRLAKEISLHA